MTVKDFVLDLEIDMQHGAPHESLRYYEKHLSIKTFFW